MDLEPDRAKYWQYRLSQKQKAGKNGEIKAKPPKPVTPEKTKKQGSFLGQNNFFTSTIEKLKNLLEDNSQRKSTQKTTYSTKQSKEVTIKKGQNNEVFKKNKKAETERKSNGNSALLSKRQKKMSGDIIGKIVNSSPQKSRSRSKSLKYKLDNPKKSKQKLKQKPLLGGKPLKKKGKSKSTLRKVETVQLPTRDEQQSWKNKLIQTMIVHGEESIENCNHNVSSFRVWQQYQQKMYNSKKRKCKVLSIYLKGFSVYLQFLDKSRLYKEQSRREVFSNFKSMVQTQEEKLLELKECLFRLKTSENIDDTLEMLIGKVNENISDLKHYERQGPNQELIRSGKLNKIKQRSEGNSEKSCSRRSSLKFIQNQSNSQLSGSQKNMSPHPSENQSELIEKECKNGMKIVVQEQNSLSYSHIQKSPVPNCFTSVKQPEPSFSFKEESSSLLIDPKFEKIEIFHTPLPKEQLKLEQVISGEKINMERDKSFNQLSKSSQMLLSASCEKKQEQNTPESTQPFVPSGHKSQEGKVQENIKIKQSSDEEKNPMFCRSPPTILPLSDLKDIELSLLNEGHNNQLIHSLNRIISSQEIENSFGEEAKQSEGTLRKRAIFDLVFGVLVEEATRQFSGIAGFKDRFIALYNNEVVQLYQQPQNRLYQQEESTTPIQVSAEYVLQLAQKVIGLAYSQDLPQRISRPLGVPSLVTLKCIRRLTSCQEDEFIQQNENGCFTEEEDNEIQEYSEIINSSLFQFFEENFSPAPFNTNQLIFNRCIYDTLNLLLDEYRPFGGRGLPGICIGLPRYSVPKLDRLVLGLQDELKRLMEIKMGLLDDKGLTNFEMQAMESVSLRLQTKDLIALLEYEFNYKQQDDTIERYELMMDIQEQIFQQEIMHFHLLLLNRGLNYGQ